MGNARAFPEGFLFGAATAGFQCDMGCPTPSFPGCVDAASDWYAYVTSPETTGLFRTFLDGGDPAIIGPGLWELYESDFDLAAGPCGHNAFRMSLEWSRIFPRSTLGIEGHENLRAVADPAAVVHYHDMFRALRERNLTPLVTLHHYTQPLWVHDGVGCTLDPDGCKHRGWLDRETILREIAKYAGFAAREFGAEVDLWGTLNEPFAVLLSGHLLPTPMRSNPPAVFLDAEGFTTAYEAMITAHARIYDAVKAGDGIDADGDGDASRVGLIHAFAPVAPQDPASELDRQAAENVFYLWNTAFLDAVILGMFDADMDGRATFRQDLAGRNDFLGVNYKVRIRVAGLPAPFAPALSPLTTFDPLSLDMSEIYPRGLYESLETLSERYRLPMIITENNGQHIPKDDVASEIRYVVENLTWLARALARGIDVRGYFYWAFMDNYEWNHGMTVPLGLYQVLPDDPRKERVPRDTVEVLASIAREGGIPRDLAERYPVE
jgi:beta-glucosidase/6-phospho-beta-glucosidase/beta-galactosidase